MRTNTAQLRDLGASPLRVVRGACVTIKIEKNMLETRVSWRIRSIQFGRHRFQSVITRPKTDGDLLARVDQAAIAGLRSNQGRAFSS